MTAEAPILVVLVGLEGRPASTVVASSLEDELRLTAWLANPDARRRVVRAVEAALDNLAQRRAP